MAEDNVGRLSSKMFFVYNRIDATQKDKLGNVIQTLGTSLNEAFNYVQSLSGNSAQFKSENPLPISLLTRQIRPEATSSSWGMSKKNSNHLGTFQILPMAKLSFNYENTSTKERQVRIGRADRLANFPVTSKKFGNVFRLQISLSISPRSLSE